MVRSQEKGLVAPGHWCCCTQCGEITHQTCLYLSFQQNAYLLAAGVIASIYVICAVILTLGVRERRGEAPWGGVQALVQGDWVHPFDLRVEKGL